MTVEDWANREAAAFSHGDKYGEIEPAFFDGVMKLADRLLSDEAVEAAARTELTIGWDELDEAERDYMRIEMRAALQAAIDAVTREEDGNE